MGYASAFLGVADHCRVPANFFGILEMRVAKIYRWAQKLEQSAG